MLLMKVQVGKISEAVRSVVPQSMWGDIVEKLDQVEQPALAFDDETDDEDEVFDPCDCDDFDDEM